MAALPLRATDRPLLAGDLNARVKLDALEVPRKVTEVAGRLDIRTARQLLSYGQAFPTALAASLGWTNEQVADAIVRLATQMGEEKAPPRPPVAFGARDPRELGDS